MNKMFKVVLSKKVPAGLCWAVGKFLYVPMDTPDVPEYYMKENGTIVDFGGVYLQVSLGENYR